MRSACILSNCTPCAGIGSEYWDHQEEPLEALPWLVRPQPRDSLVTHIPEQDTAPSLFSEILWACRFSVSIEYSLGVYGPSTSLRYSRIPDLKSVLDFKYHPQRDGNKELTPRSSLQFLARPLKTASWIIPCSFFPVWNLCVIGRII